MQRSGGIESDDMRMLDSRSTSNCNKTHQPASSGEIRQLTDLADTDFESWGKESFEIATKIAYRNGGTDRDSEGWHGLHDDCSRSRASRPIRC